MASESEDREGTPLHYEGGIPVFDGKSDREESERRADKKRDNDYKKQQILIQNGMLLTQIALVIFGLIGAGVSAYQAHTARLSADAATQASKTAKETLTEMQTGGEAQDTHTLALQAVTQATQTTNLASDTRDLAQTSKDSLVTVQRAFLAPHAVIDPIYDTDGKTATGIKLVVRWENNGTTPTKQMTVHFNGRFGPDIPEDFSFPDVWSDGTPQINDPGYRAKG